MAGQKVFVLYGTEYIVRLGLDHADITLDVIHPDRPEAAGQVSYKMELGLAVKLKAALEELIPEVERRTTV